MQERSLPALSSLELHSQPPALASPGVLRRCAAYYRHKQASHTPFPGYNPTLLPAAWCRAAQCHVDQLHPQACCVLAGNWRQSLLAAGCCTAAGPTPAQQYPLQQQQQQQTTQQGHSDVSQDPAEDRATTTYTSFSAHQLYSVQIWGVHIRSAPAITNLLLFMPLPQRKLQIQPRPSYLRCLASTEG